MKMTDVDRLDIEITPEELEELLQDLPAILRELTGDNESPVVFDRT
ncbi:hypothetical protein SRRS_07800 [Sporomusa rhizae]